MPHNRAHAFNRSHSRFVAPLVVVSVGVASLGAGAAGAATSKPTAAPGFKLTKLAAAPKGVTNCDDLALLDGHLFMGCQNAVLSNGKGGPPNPKSDTSTLVEYTTGGKLVKTWAIKNKIDGVGADPLHHRVILTLDEDANSRLVTVDPAAPAAQQVVNYTYSPDPRGTSTPPALRTGGGTDSVTVDSTGHIFVTGSHAGTTTGTATFKVALTPPSSAGGTGTAALSPTFLDNATATNGNAGSGAVKLALGDVDSAAIVPPSSPKYAGDYVIDDQTALQLVFASNLNTGTGLTVLKTAFGLDDVRWATASGGTLYIVDKGSQTPLGISSLYKLTGPFVKGGVYAANDGVSDQVVKVDLTNGKVTPIVKGLGASKGLVYADPSGALPSLSLAVPVSGTASASATSSASSAAPPSSSSTTAAAKKSGGSSDTGTIIGIGVVVLLIVGTGGYLLSRRRAANPR